MLALATFPIRATVRAVAAVALTEPLASVLFGPVDFEPGPSRTVAT